jgi:hypothetical protein
MRCPWYRLAARWARGGSERTLVATAQRSWRRKHAAYLGRVCVAVDAAGAGCKRIFDPRGRKRSHSVRLHRPAGDALSLNLTLKKANKKAQIHKNIGNSQNHNGCLRANDTWNGWRAWVGLFRLYVHLQKPGSTGPLAPFYRIELRWLCQADFTVTLGNWQVDPSLCGSHLTLLVSDSKSLTLGAGKVTEALSHFTHPTRPSACMLLPWAGASHEKQNGTNEAQTTL